MDSAWALSYRLLIGYNDVVRPGSTIREEYIDTPYRGTLC